MNQNLSCLVVEGVEILLRNLCPESGLYGRFSNSEHLVKERFFTLGGCNIEGEDESWDFGTGAGFYVDATEDPWKTNYRMYSYVKDEVTLLLGSPGVAG